MDKCTCCYNIRPLTPNTVRGKTKGYTFNLKSTSTLDTNATVNAKIAVKVKPVTIEQDRLIDKLKAKLYTYQNGDFSSGTNVSFELYAANNGIMYKLSTDKNLRFLEDLHPDIEYNKVPAFVRYDDPIKRIELDDASTRRVYGIIEDNKATLVRANEAANVNVKVNVNVNAKAKSEPKPIDELKAKLYTFINGEYVFIDKVNFLLYKLGDIHEYKLDNDNIRHKLSDLELHSSGKGFLWQDRNTVQLIKLNADNIKRILDIIIEDNLVLETNYEEIFNISKLLDEEGESYPKVLPPIINLKAGLNITQWTLFDSDTAEEWFRYFEQPNNINYLPKEETRVKVFGKMYDAPRQVTAYGDPGIKYEFSGSVINVTPWTPEMLTLKSLVEKTCGYTFNYVLVNRYKDGKDTVGFHQDNEKDLIPDAPIASLSLGATRDFVLKHAQVHKRREGEFSSLPKVVIPLVAGNLLVMNYPTNRDWYYSVPRRVSVKNPRINLTFRRMKVKK